MCSQFRLSCLALAALSVAFSGNVAWAQHHHGGGSAHSHGGGGGGSVHHHGHSSPGYGGYGSRYGGSGFGFSFGGSGIGFGYRSGVGNYYGPGLSNYGYYNSRPYVQPYYYSQPGIVVPQQVYVTPSYSYIPAEPRYDGGEILLFNPAGSEGPVDYALNGYRYAIKPGESQKFRNDRHWVIAIPRGATGDPEALYTLSTGRFKFKKSDKGWDVVSVEESAPVAQPTDGRPAPPAPTSIDSKPAEVKPAGTPTLILPKPATP
ncbi:MAG: hypothetical protein HZA46_20240 [Planctomycetales bacterium]|nr:hypothetical protein [Planctomycetales bacterium]